MSNYNQIHKHITPSGLECVLYPKDTPIVSSNLMYKVGSKNEIFGKSGIAHLLEHLMFEGTHNLEKGLFDKVNSINGGTNNAYTTYDHTAYTITSPVDSLETILWLESDRMYNLNITKEALKNQQDVVSEEIKQVMHGQPYGTWRERMAKINYGSNCSYSWEVAGSIDDVNNFTLNDLQEFHSSFYNPTNAKLTLVGGIDVDKTKVLLDKYFAKVANPLTKYSEFELNKLVNGYLEEKKKVPMNAVFFSFHCEGFLEDNDIYKLALFCNLLGLGRSAPLPLVLVHEKDIASNVGVFLDRRAESSQVTFYAIAQNNNVSNQEMYEEIILVLKNILNNGFKSNDFIRAKNYLTTHLATDLQRASNIADSLSFFNTFYGKPEEHFNILEKYNSIYEEELIEVANKVFDLNLLNRLDYVADTTN